jgi:ABC-2 type transport system permease protein
MAALYGMGMLFASVFLVSGRDAWHMANLFQEPIYLVSGIFFPIKALGTWVAVAASLIPMTLGMDAIRQLAFEGGPTLGFLAVELELAILAGLTVLFIGAALFALRKLEREGRRNGRLTERRR